MHIPRDTYERATDLLDPMVRAAVAAFGGRAFSTRRLIETIRATEAGQQAYAAAIQMLEEDRGEPMAKHILHGQIVPEILRGSHLVRFAGFIHGEPDEDDGYAVPSRWRSL